jgi:hypothetical protein
MMSQRMLTAAAKLAVYHAAPVMIRHLYCYGYIYNSSTIYIVITRNTSGATFRSTHPGSCTRIKLCVAAEK